MDRRHARLLGVALAALLVGAACGGDGGDTTPTTEGDGGDGGTVQIAGQDANEHGSKDVSGMDELSLEMDDFYFSPTILQGEAGQTLTIELENEGGAPHTFTIDDQSVDVEVAAGEAGTAEVTFPDSGEVLFYCRFHEGQGMRGGLTVG